jgi:hypothetical protein
MVCFVNGYDDRGRNGSELKKGIVGYNYVNITQTFPNGADP